MCHMKRLIFLLLAFWAFGVCPSSLYPQKSKLYVLAYKYKEGDKYRVSTSSYNSFTTVSGKYASTFTSETAFDVYQEIEGGDEEAYDMKMRIELTRFSENGKNFTYKLGSLFRGDEIRLSFDRFGHVLPGTVEQTLSDSTQVISHKVSSLIPLLFLPLPDRAIKTGDTWQITDFLSPEQLLSLVGPSFGIKKPEIRGIYTLESVNESLATVSLSVEISGSGRPAETKGLPELDFLIQMTGSFVFSIAEGKVINGNLTTDAVGVAVIGDMNVDFKGNLQSVFSVEKYK